MKNNILKETFTNTNNNSQNQQDTSNYNPNSPNFTGCYPGFFFVKDWKTINGIKVNGCVLKNQVNTPEVTQQVTVTPIPINKPTEKPIKFIQTKMPQVIKKLKVLQEKIKIIDNEQQYRKYKEYFNYVYYTLTLFAIYISYRCNGKKFKLDSIIYSIIFGPIYLIYKFTTDYKKCFK